MRKNPSGTPNCNICPQFGCTIEERRRETLLNKGFYKAKIKMFLNTKNALKTGDKKVYEKVKM